MTKSCLLASLLVLAPAWWGCRAPHSTAVEAAQPPEPDEPTPVPSPEPGEPDEPLDPPELAEPTLEPEPGLPTPDPSAPCCFNHPRYAGACSVTPAADETCASILAYLNDQNSTGKTYCQSTDLRGGWKPVQCLEE